MAEGFIVRKAGGGATTEAPTINVTEETSILKFTLTNNDDNTAFVTYKIDTLFDTVELTSGATSSEITIDTLPDGTYTLEAYATVVGEVVTSDTVGITLALATYELIADVEVTSNTTQIDFDNLNITKNDELRLVYTFDSNGGNTHILVNDNTTLTNYYSQLLGGNGSSIVAARGNYPRLTSGDTVASGFADIKVSNNDRFVYQSRYSIGIGSNSSALYQRNWNGASTFTVLSINKISVIGSSLNNIAPNSRFTLYKVNKGVA